MPGSKSRKRGVNGYYAVTTDPWGRHHLDPIGTVEEWIGYERDKQLHSSEPAAPIEHTLDGGYFVAGSQFGAQLAIILGPGGPKRAGLTRDEHTYLRLAIQSYNFTHCSTLLEPRSEKAPRSWPTD